MSADPVGPSPKKSGNILNTRDGYEHGAGDRALWEEIVGQGDGLPEHDWWQRLCESLERRNLPELQHCIRELWSFASRRGTGEELQREDAYPRDSELTGVDELADAWRTYKTAVHEGDSWAMESAMMCIEDAAKKGGNVGSL